MQLPRKTDDIDLLCEAGEEGWELVAILPNIAALSEARSGYEPSGLRTEAPVSDHLARRNSVLAVFLKRPAMGCAKH
jgi:hypothetical protein